MTFWDHVLSFKLKRRVQAYTI